MQFPISATDLVARLLVAMICGALLGFDREMRHKAAGLRTHMMVSLGAASFTLAALHLAAVAAAVHGPFGDPTRIIQGITAGVGFLGGGSIVRARGTIEGITTASSIWVVGAVGLACGGGAYLLAGVTAVLAFVTLRLLGVIERRLLQ
jgi:putative Mg2+ transporter-C (MgtC) family protein